MSTQALAMMAGNGPGEGASALNLPDLQEFLSEVSDMGAQRVSRFENYRAYYDGDHAVELTDRAREYLEANGEIDWAENYCEPIVDEVAHRLMVERISASAPDMDESRLIEVGQFVSDWWQRGKVDQVASVVHTNCLIDGEAFVGVEWDNDKAQPTLAYSDPANTRAFYPSNDPTTPEYVSKRWTTSEAGPSNPNGREIERLNVYYPDRIERYFAFGRDTDRTWEFWLEEGQPWPTPWLDANGQPLGIPMIHFRNKPLGGTRGRSELRSDVPFQDLHNKLVIDLAVVLDNQAWNQRWITGANSGSAALRNVPGEVWFIPEEEAALGEFRGEDPRGLLEAIESGLNRRARRSRIPMHLLTGGDMPSGEALRSAEAPLVKKIESKMGDFGNSWEAALAVALRMAGTQVDLPNDVVLSVEWRDAATPDPVGQLEAAMMKKDLGVSKATLLEELGYDPAQEAERRAEEGPPPLASALLDFDRDTDGGPEQEAQPFSSDSA